MRPAGVPPCHRTFRERRDGDHRQAGRRSLRDDRERCDLPVDGPADAVGLHLVTVEDALDGRRAIELGAADQSIGRASAPELAELRRRMEATAPLVRGGRFVDIERYTATNAAFHEYMVSLARSQSLVHAYRRLAVPGIMARTLSSSDIADDGLVDDHRQLVEAYELGDLSTAQAVIERHTERSKGVHRRAAERKGEHHTTGGSNGP